jgi:predicted acylesterase/phospholipase RssA
VDVAVQDFVAAPNGNTAARSKDLEPDASGVGGFFTTNREPSSSSVNGRKEQAAITGAAGAAAADENAQRNPADASVEVKKDDVKVTDFEDEGERARESLDAAAASHAIATAAPAVMSGQSVAAATASSDGTSAAPLVASGQAQQDNVKDAKLETSVSFSSEDST